MLVFQDELTYYWQPTAAQGFAAATSAGPRAERSQRANTATRVVATLDFLTGQVAAQQAPQIGVRQLLRFSETLVAQVPGVEGIYLVEGGGRGRADGRPSPVRGPGGGPADPIAAAADLGLLEQSDREALALAQTGRAPPPSLGQRSARAPPAGAGVLAAFTGGSPALLRYVGLTTPPSGIRP